MREFQQLNDLIKEYFTTDSFGVNPSQKLESDEEKRARSTLQQTTRKVGHQYEVGLLWKEYPPKLPSSRAMAEKRLWTVEKRMRGDGEFRMQYREGNV